MEQVVFRVHVRVVTTICNVLGPKARKAIENILLLLAVLSVVGLYFMHIEYASHYSTNNCLSRYISKEGVKNADVLEINIIPVISPELLSLSSPPSTWASAIKESLIRTSEVTDTSCVNSASESCTTAFIAPTVSYLFSAEKGFLHVSEESFSRLHMSKATINIADSSSCLGPRAYVWLLNSFVGYDTVVKNWAIRSFGGHGHLVNTNNSEYFDLVLASDFGAKTGTATGTATTETESGWLQSLQHYLAFKLGICLTTIFLFFTTTTLVSFTLRVTQERMLKFTFLLQYHIGRRLPIANLVVTHLIETLVFVPLMVGMMFFLFEFFQDQLLAFLVLSVVWIDEVFSVISLRTSISIRFFPLIFFVYFCFFHVYFFSFPFGFSYMALFSMILFLTHAMWHFWCSYEVPAYEAGLVTALTPRAGGLSGVFHPVHTGGRVSTGATTAASSTTSDTAGTSTTAAASGASGTGGDASSLSSRASVESVRVRMSTGVSAGLGQRLFYPPFNPAAHRLHQAATTVPVAARPLPAGTGPAGAAPQDSSAAGGVGPSEAPLAALSPRERYNQHVELSRKIQKQQMAAMLGIGLDFDIDQPDDNDVGLDIDE